jgi:hypothetical protein
MEGLNNYGVINSQRFLDKFNWNGKEFYSYLISFNEYDGFFRIVRQSDYEQALIGAQMIFSYSQESSKITKYRIVGFAGLTPTKKQNKNERT